MSDEKKTGASEKVSIDDSQFEQLEKDYHEVMQELLGDRSLEKFRVEYEKLHRALKKSHDSEKRLMSKCRELNAEIVSNSAKVSTALKLSQEDQSTITSLKKEIEKAWKMVDAAHEKETRAKETITQLKNEIANLSKLVEQGTGLAVGQEHSVNELLKIKEDLSKQRDEQLQQIAELRNQLNSAVQLSQTTENDKQELANKIAELTQDITMKQNEAQREARRKDKLESEIRHIKVDNEAKTDEIKQLNAQIERYRNDMTRNEQLIKDQKISIEKSSKEIEILQQRLSNLQDDHDDQATATAELARQNQERVAELRRREEDINNLKADIAKVTKQREAIQRKLRVVEEQKTEADEQRDMFRTQIQSLEKEMEMARKQTDSDKKKIEELMREKDTLNKQCQKAVAATGKQQELVKIHEQAKRNLDQEIVNYREEAQKQRKIIYQLEKERDRYINEASDLTQKVLKHMEEVKVREMEIFDLKKKIAESETKLKQQQNLYEAVRSDRNLYSKNLIESQDEITEMRRKLKITSHQIDQLKEEINSKEAQLVKEHHEKQKVTDEKEMLSAELTQLKNQMAQTKAYINSQQQEERKLLKIIADADAERLRQKKELEQVIAERDILGTQLVRRNDELALLYEKIKIQQSVLNKGEQQFNSRIEDIRILKLEIRKMRREKAILQRSVSNVDELKREVYHLQKQLLQERTRCKALEEELENPLNVHRWRKLEGSDPSTYEMIKKTQHLQKRLINKTQEVVEKEILVQEKDKLYLELKHILARQPGPEVAEQLSLYQQTLKEKTKQMKAMAGELNMYENQISESRFELDRLGRELGEVKKKYYVQKKKERQTIEERMLNKALTSAENPSGLGLNSSGGALPPILPQNRSDVPRFAGGGFSLKPGNKAA